MGARRIEIVSFDSEEVPEPVEPQNNIRNSLERMLCIRPIYYLPSWHKLYDEQNTHRTFALEEGYISISHVPYTVVVVVDPGVSEEIKEAVGRLAEEENEGSGRYTVEVHLL
ncbi:hypothetical protein COT52_02485 [candidate division WWE3 bacterium CG08_land_8_20_14_0_20_43_13]|uniref:Uncharacterized protein n=1 Tax=candidate division WWE3 bacterium CG08_land_8_20_14_0_20_43_13 TaxID=1975087 RepID=A0A2H0X771_UNCKA|nr:MAG: hypothetical protein COT52_02485 [candidate division WWE3 bacterium CG08_land_8_20_14_0_20_43_13]